MITLCIAFNKPFSKLLMPSEGILFVRPIVVRYRTVLHLSLNRITFTCCAISYASEDGLIWNRPEDIAVPRVQSKEDQVRLVAPTQMALCLRPCLLRLLRRELLRAFATLDDSTPQRRISELRVWSYEPFIVFAPSSSGYTSGQNLEVLYILNNRNNQNILRNYALHIKKLKQ